MKYGQSGYPCPRCGKPLSKGSKTPSGKQRWLCRTRKDGATTDYCYSTTKPEAKAARNQRSQETKLEAHSVDVPEDETTFIVTYAQNATPVHAAFWKALKQAAKHYDATLLVQAGRYQNPTSVWTKNDDNNQWYAPEVKPYLTNERTTLNKNLEFLADISIVPTAVTPLTGLEGFGARSKIVGHPRLQFKTVATPGHKMAAALSTTGACTKSNYTDSRSGKLGQFHHTLGAVLVEIEGPLFWIRHLNANSKGEFIDLDKRFTPDGVRKAPRASAIVVGDTHARVADPAVDAATFGKGGMVECYKPRKIFWHDVLDGQSANRHEAKDPFVDQALASEGMDNVEAECRHAAEYVRDRTPAFARSYVVPSNHHDFVTTWIIDRDWKKLAAVNRECYLSNALAMVRGAKLVDGMPSYPSPFPEYIARYAGPRVESLGSNGHTVDGIQCGFHGHKGPGGARGSIKNMRRIGEKTIIGHSHSPGIDEGCMQVGHTAKTDQPYARGAPSSWMHANALVYPGGKRQLIIIVNGRHRR